MGGGFRSERPSYTRSSSINNNSSLNDYTNNSSSGSTRAFISFHIEDEAMVNLLRSQAKDDRFELEFTDYSVKEPFDEKWKTQCTERIRQSSVIIVMIGAETYQREAVIWEINKAYELGKPVIGVRIFKDKNHYIPEAMITNGAKIVNWNMAEIQNAMDRAK